MHFDLEQRRAWLSAGELAEFGLGPRDGGSGAAGLWRAQLGVHWHRELRERTAADSPAARFEVETQGEVPHRGWTLALNGRIDQILDGADGPLLREIKTVTRPLPAPEAELRADYPSYFVQLAAYLEIEGGKGDPRLCRGELLFVEAASGALQAVALQPSDRAFLHAQLDRVAQFLELRLRGAERLRRLRFRPPFSEARPGQAEALEGLREAARAGAKDGRPARALLEAPTGFGKTGVLLEFALGELKAGRFERVLYLTGKSTGQLQVVRTLQAMMNVAGLADAARSAEMASPEGESRRDGPGRVPLGRPGPQAGPPSDAPLAVWQVRAKAEHCVNSTYDCVRERCAYLDGVADRWGESGLSRFYLFEGERRDLEALREAGRAARICPYEITRAALAFNDVWIGDYNYVFSPATRGLFFLQPGFEPGRSLLVVDEAHNLPQRAADARSHVFLSSEAEESLSALRRIGAPAGLMAAWGEWADFLHALSRNEGLEPAAEAEARGLILRLADELTAQPLDRGALPEGAGERLWQAPAAAAELESMDLPRLWWAPRAGELRITCLDAAEAIGAALEEFGGCVLASATPGPLADFAGACGLPRLRRGGAPTQAEPPAAPAPGKLGDLGKRETRRLLSRLTTGAGLLQAGTTEAGLVRVEAPAPWRDHAYDVAVDLRVDTSYRERERHHATTAETIGALRRAGPGPIAVFFSSYAYAERIAGLVGDLAPDVRAALQPRRSDLATQAAWVEETLGAEAALFLVLGSSFSESIDLLGGRIGRAMVVGPALPEVNPVQKARLAAFAAPDRDAAFRRVYRIPGMQKVNQALGRLVRAPGQAARVLLHCRRFAEPAYAQLLAQEYQSEARVRDNGELAAWLGS